MSNLLTICLASFFFDVQSKINEIVTTFRNFSKKNKDRCLHNLSKDLDTMIVKLADVSDPQSRLEIITSVLTEICNKYFPMKRKKVSFLRYRAPWITSTIIKLINKKHRLYKAFKNKSIHIDEFRHYCRGLKLLLYRVETNYHKNRLHKTKFNPMKKWAYINTLLGRNQERNVNSEIIINNEKTDDSSKISEFANDYFKEIPLNIHNEIPTAIGNYDNTIPMSSKSLFFEPISPKEICEITANLKSSSTLNPIPIKFLKLIMPQFSNILAGELNNCFQKGIYPSCLNTATVIPIFKSGSPEIITNYRPISLLPSLGKIFERIIYNRIYSYITKNGLVAKNQFGFIKGRSTTHANVKLNSNTIGSITDECFSISVFLDFSKAFDCVAHEILLYKLHRYGIRGAPLDLMKAYLSSRSQKVKYSDSFSKKTEVSVGVPQGSCNGPLLYLLYCNDLMSVINDVDVIMYADDTVLTITGKDIPDMVKTMNTCLATLQDWCNFNKLKINPLKSKAVIFSNRKYTDVPPIVIDGTIINYVNHIKYLGLNIDKKMNFSRHIAYLTSKLASISGISYKLGNKFDLHSAKLFYYSFVHSYLSYCVEVWGGNLIVYKYTRLHKLWEKILRNLFSYHVGSSDINKICKDLSILDPLNIYKFYVMTLMYNILHNNVLPEIRFYPKRNNYKLRQEDEFVVPFPRTNIVKCNFYYQMILIWNSLPNNIKTRDNNDSGNNIGHFRMVYKKYLLECQ